MSHPTPTAGGTSLLTYRPYRGRLRGPLAGAWAIARTGLWMILRRKLFWGLYGCCGLIFLFFFFGQYLSSWLAANAGEQTVSVTQTSRIRLNTVDVLGNLRTQLKLNGTGETYRNLIWYEGTIVMVVLALAG